MIVGCDTETGRFRPGLLIPPLVVVSWAANGEAGLEHHSTAEPVVEALFQAETAWANFPYDGAVICERYPRLAPLVFEALLKGLVHDVLTRQKLLDIAQGRAHGKRYSLAEVARRHLGIEMDKSKDTYRLRYGELLDVPVELWPEEARQYALDDPAATVLVYDAQEEAAAEFELEYPGTDVLGNEAHQVRAHWALHLMSCWGVKADPAAVEVLDRRILDEWEACRDRLVEAGLVRKNGSRDTKAAKARMAELYAALGKNPKPTKGASGHVDKVEDISLDEEACLTVGDPIMRDYQKFGSLLGLRSRVVESLRRGTVHPIQPRYEELVETGRTSCSKPNIQNLPRSGGFRECLVPRPGHVFVCADWGMAELVSLAQVCLDKLGHSKLAEALRDGEDPHCMVAAQIMGRPYLEVKAAYKDGDGDVKHMRDTAKPCNFGFPGGLGPERFVSYAKMSYKVEVSLDQAIELKRTWARTWPEMRDYFRWIEGLMDGDLAWIIQHKSKRCRGAIRYTEACNTFFQGLTADAAKDCLWEICREQHMVPTSPLYGEHQVMFVHDENVMEVREERAHEVAMHLSRLMVEVYGRWCPDVPIKAEAIITRRYSKKAKQIWSPEGRLMPWG